MLLLVVAAAGLADEHATVQTLAFAVDQELEGLQAADAQRAARVVLRSQQLSLCVLFLNLSLQLSETTTMERITHSPASLGDTQAKTSGLDCFITEWDTRGVRGPGPTVNGYYVTVVHCKQTNQHNFLKDSLTKYKLNKTLYSP